MGDVRQYGGPCCATCGDRGILTDLEGRPTQCVPCSSERSEAQRREWGYVLDCNGCTAVLTVEDVQVGRVQPRPRSWSIYGPLCGYCMRDMERQRIA